MNVKENENITLEERLARCFEPVKVERRMPETWAICLGRD